MILCHTRFTMLDMHRSFPLAGALLVLAACEKGDKVPSYLRMDQATVNANTSIQGTSSSKIPGVWVYANDKAIGVWQVPSRLPVLGGGPIGIKVVAGIARNGVADDLVQYPFFATWETTVPGTPERTDTLRPGFEYFEGLDFWIEGFEDAGVQFLDDVDSDTALYRIVDEAQVFEGNASAGFFLDQDHGFARFYTDQDFAASDGPAYLELDYRCDHQFLIGVRYEPLGGVASNTPYLFVNPTGSGTTMPWKKIYVDLSSALNNPSSAPREIYFEGQLLGGASAARIYLDNVKLVRRQL
jgi:hypothetical protein